MLRYGKKLDRCYGDKIARSNRGRARTSATAQDRKHVNPGHRRGQDQIAKIRANKKRSRLTARLFIEGERFDLELAKCDPEIWLHGTDLTTFEDTVTKPHRGYPGHLSGFITDPYEYVPDEFDWDWEGTLYHDQADEDAFCYYGSDWDSDWDTDPDPAPSDAAWRDLWVDGYVHDPEDRDQSAVRTYDWWYDEDSLDDFDNPLLVREETALPATIEAVEERNIERRRAGDRYFKQTGRTVFKRVGVEKRAP